MAPSPVAGFAGRRARRGAVTPDKAKEHSGGGPPRGLPRMMTQSPERQDLTIPRLICGGGLAGLPPPGAVAPVVAAVFESSADMIGESGRLTARYIPASFI